MANNLLLKLLQAKMNTNGAEGEDQPQAPGEHTFEQRFGSINPTVTEQPETKLEVEPIDPNEPTLFDRVSSAMKKQQELGNIGVDSGNVAASPLRKPAAVPVAQEKELQTQAVAPQNNGNIDPYGADLNDEALKQALEAGKRNRMIGELANAGSQIGSAISRGAAPALEVGKDLIARADLDAKNIQTRREGKDKDLQRQKNMAELNDVEAMRDPKSPISVSVREGLQKLFPNIKLPDSVSGKQLHDMGINFGTLIAAKENADARRESAALRAQEREDKQDTKKQDKLDKDITKHSERLNKSGVPAAIETLQEIDGLLSGGLDSTKGDIPGYGMADGLAPGFVLSEKGQKLRQAVQRLANIQLKDRSGSAVSDQEYKRFQNEFGSGTMKTEKELLNGLRQYRNVLSRVTKELEASAPQGALAEYKDRPGSAKSELIPGADKQKDKKSNRKVANKPKTVIQNGHTYTLNEETGEYE